MRLIPIQDTFSTHLKKSVLQNNFPSLEKHLSAKWFPQSVQVTQVVCQGRSKTFNKNLSVMGLSHPAHGCVPTPAVPTPIAATAAEKSAGVWSPAEEPSTPPNLAAKCSDSTGVVPYGSAALSSSICPPPNPPSEPGRAAADNVTAVVMNNCNHKNTFYTERV